MPSADESPRSGVAQAAGLWNRRLHWYTGLYFLFFLWLFSFTGLVLNHPKWTFADFWPARKQSTFERAIQPPPSGSDLVQAKDVMRQTGIEGETEWTKLRSNPNRFEFRVSRPGHIVEVAADFERSRATVHRIDVNAWGAMRMLHLFTGAPAAEPRNQRDWVLTTVWALSMDALSVGLIVMVLTSAYMWWPQRRKRALGLAALGAGIVSCGLFVFVLRWLF